MNIERSPTMNAIEFVESLNRTRSTEDLAQMKAHEYFNTFAGKQIISFLAEKIRFIDARSFELVDFYVTSELEKNPLYRGRDFFSDMKDLGFTYEITSYHQEEVPIKTYLFKV